MSQQLKKSVQTTDTTRIGCIPWKKRKNRSLIKRGSKKAKDLGV